MIGAYAYTPEIWPPLAGVIFLAILGLYSWRHRDVPAALPLAVCMLFGILWLLGLALVEAAVAPATKIAWQKFQAAWQLPAITAMTCFALEYAYPGRWLTRRNLSLLALPSLIPLLLIVIDNAQLMWRRLEVAPDGVVVRHFATPGTILIAYGVGLGLVNIAAFIWLFVRSPQHRWPVAFMLFGEIAGRGLYLRGVAQAPSLTGFDPVVGSFILLSATYAIALFGFRIFDPLPAARATALAQMPDGMIVFDAQWRVARLNPAAAGMLSIPAAHTRGKTLAELLPALPDLSARLADAPAGPDPIEISLGTQSCARLCALDLSALMDFRGLRIGHLLMLRDVTEQRRTQAQILEQQRTLATLQERERLAREMHDGVAQVLAAVHVQASTAKLLLSRGETALLDKCLDGLDSTALQAQADVREYLLVAKTGFSPDRPFFPTLREYLLRLTRQCGLPVELTVTPQLEEQGLAQTVEVQLLRIIQEALSNVRKHAGAGCVHVDFSLAGSQARIAIIDDGRGFDPAAIASRADGYGLRSMRERAEAAGGSLTVVSGAGQGTQVVVHMPLKA